MQIQSKAKSSLWWRGWGSWLSAGCVPLIRYRLSVIGGCSRARWKMGVMATLFFLTQPTFAQVPQLSDFSSVSLITVSPGEELYSGFGHSALWVADPAQGIDRVYNYGTFDFRTEGFYIKFLRGQLPYQLSVGTLEGLMYGARIEQRSVREQVLNLTKAQRQRVFEYLENNYQPLNRQYAYKFFYDNCSSRLRDVLQNSLKDSVVFNNYLVERKLAQEAGFDGTFPKTYRGWIHRYAAEKKPWADFGMSLAIGQPADDSTNYYTAMFLPDNLSGAFSFAGVHAGGKWVPLVGRNTMLFTPYRTQVERGSLLTPALLAWLLLFGGAFLTITQVRDNKKGLLFDKILFSVVGLAGWLLAFLWFGTDHGVTRYNWNLVWALPFHFPLALLLSTKRNHWLSRYYLMAGILSILLLVAWAFLPQELPSALVPVVLLLIVRSFWVAKTVK
ncbi:MAG: DUF4105 domain-containing protein [Spirosomataceae bacterium]